jgi:hypothetical protein
VASNADYVLIPERNPADLKGMMAKLREVKSGATTGWSWWLKAPIIPILRSGPVKSPGGLNGTRLGEAAVEIDSFGHPILKERRVGDWCAWHIRKEWAGTRASA